MCFLGMEQFFIFFKERVSETQGIKLPALLVTKPLPLIGRPGGLGRGEMLWVSPSAPSITGRPNIASSSLASGGGMG